MLGVTGAFGGSGELPEGSDRVMASRITEYRIGTHPKQQPHRPRNPHPRTLPPIPTREVVLADFA